MIYTTKKEDFKNHGAYEGLTNSQATMKYNKEFSVPVMIRLNKKTDKDIIDFLESQKDNSKAGTVKNVLRKYITELNI